MKRIYLNVIVLLCSALVLVATDEASDQKDCSPCRENVNRLFVQFKTEYEFGISHFNENVCPHMSDSDNCVTKNTEWWPYLSQIIYSDQAPKYVCQALDPDCTFERISNCDECKSGISGLTKGYAEGSEELIKTLKGDTFCESRLLNLGSDEKIKECQDFLEIYIPNVLLSISEKVAEDSHLLCYDLYDEICPLDADLESDINQILNLSSLDDLKNLNLSDSSFDELKNTLSEFQETLSNFNETLINLNQTFKDMNLTDLNLFSNFSLGNLGFPQLNLTNLSFNLTDSILADLNITDYNLTDFSLSDLNLTDVSIVDLNDLDLSELSIGDLNITDLTLTDLNVTDLGLTDTFLTDLILTDSNLTLTDIEYSTDFADLEITDFTESPLTESNNTILTDLDQTDSNSTDYTDYTDYDVDYNTDVNTTDYEYVVSENGCDICRKNVYAVFSAISFEYAIIEKFNQNICTTWNDTEDCQNKVNGWGPYIFSTIYNEQTANFFCTELDPDCEATQFVECGECGRDVSVLVEAYASEEASFSTIMALQKGLCPSSDLDLETEDDVKECQQFMEDFMPIALRQIADYVIGNRRKFCNELFDVCTLDQTNEDVVTEIAITEIAEDGTGECNSCKNSVNKVLEELRTHSLSNTVSNFTEKICPTINESTDCEVKIVNWWPIIAQIIYSEEAASLVCEELDPGCTHNSALWDCNECKSDLSSLLEGYASEESSNEIVGVLQNDFCPNPDLDLGGEDNIEDCQNFMPLFIPDAMKQISQMVAEHSPVLCQNLFDIPCRVEGAGEPRG